MTDNNEHATANGNGAAPDGESKPNVQVLGQYIRDLSFENPKAPASLQGPGENPKMQIEVNVGAKKVADDVYESAITFNAKSTTDEGTVYELELVYAGLAKLENVPDNALQPVLLINCPALIFPFLRRVVADITREGGFPPLMLDPIDFGTLYANNLQKQQDDVMKQVAADPADS